VIRELNQVILNVRICDPRIKPSYIEWNDSVIYPEGNILAGQFCVEAWVDDEDNFMESEDDSA